MRVRKNMAWSKNKVTDLTKTEVKQLGIIANELACAGINMLYFFSFFSTLNGTWPSLHRFAVNWVQVKWGRIGFWKSSRGIWICYGKLMKISWSWKHWKWSCFGWLSDGEDSAPTFNSGPRKMC